MSTSPQNGDPPSRQSPDDELGTGHLLGNIGRRSLRGGVVTLGAQGLKVLIQIGALIVLARLLPPAAFGLVAMVAALTALLDVVKEFGFSAVTIQKADVSHTQVSALFWLNTAVGSLIALGLFLGAPLLASFYDQPELVPIARWLALGFVLSGLTVQHWALLRRQMRFEAIAGIETGADVCAFAVAIAVACLGGDYWALVAQRLVYVGTTLIASWVLCRWRPALPARAPELPAMVRFGGSVAVCYLATVLTRSVDQMLIGWLFGPAILGAYERAARLLMLPINSINGPVYAVGMPALSRLAGQQQRYRHLVRQMMQKLAMLTMPVFALVAVTADWIVQLVFGLQWQAAAPIAMLFGVSATYLPVVLALGLLYQSQGRTREMLRATFIDSGLSVAAILAGLPFGAVGVAAAIALAGLLVRTPLAFWLATRHGPVKQSDLYTAVAPAAIAAVLCAAAVCALRQFPPADAAAPVEGLAMAGVVGLCAMALTFLALPESRRALLALRRLHLPQQPG